MSAIRMEIKDGYINLWSGNLGQSCSIQISFSKGSQCHKRSGFFRSSVFIKKTRLLILIAYSIGVIEPVSVMLYLMRTKIISKDRITEYIHHTNKMFIT